MSDSTTALGRTRRVLPQQRHVHERERRGDDDGRERGLREVGEQRVQEEEKDGDDPGADEPGQLRLCPGLLGHRGARPARRDCEPLDETGGEVRGPHPDHLLIGLDLVTAPSSEARRGRNRVGERHEGDAHGGDEERPDVVELGPRQLRRRNTLRQGADRGHAFRREVEDRRESGCACDRDQDCRHALGHLRKHEQDDQHGDADPESSPDRLVEVGEERAHLLEEAVGVGREPEELRQLADDDGDRQAVHVADLHLAREEVGDESELCYPEADLDDPDEQREHAGELDRLHRVVARDEQWRQGGEDHR